jgi:hypothetical protein
MKVLALILQELAGMFVDDEFLAFAVLAVVAATAALVAWTSVPSAVAGAVLLLGCALVVSISVIKTSRKA